MSLLCKIFGHKWKYNFPVGSIPFRAICSRCEIKMKLNLAFLEWHGVDDFENEKRTNKELIDTWF